jgi:hypothetical protein
MNKQELKEILKPLIKECIREVVFEEGALSSVVSEVVKGMGQPIQEQVAAPVIVENKPSPKPDRLTEQRKRMLDAIGADAYNGVDLFEGTTPAPSQGPSTGGPLEGTDPKDAGVDISAVIGKSSAIWSKLVGK